MTSVVHFHTRRMFIDLFIIFLTRRVPERDSGYSGKNTLRTLVVKKQISLFSSLRYSKLYPSYLKAYRSNSRVIAVFPLWFFMVFWPFVSAFTCYLGMVSWSNSTCCRLSWWMDTRMQSQGLQRVDRSNRAWAWWRQHLQSFRCLLRFHLVNHRGAPPLWRAEASRNMFNIVDHGVKYRGATHQSPETSESHWWLCNNLIINLYTRYESLTQ